MKFTKMQGCGNDFVLLNGFESAPTEITQLALRMCNRRFGVGSDGLILALPSKVAEVRMLFHNPDGTEAEMCGNGIRCLARFAMHEGLVLGNRFRVETGAGIKEVEIRCNQVRVDMGAPVLEPGKMPVNHAGPSAVNIPLCVENREFRATCVSMGNPHCVIFEPAITDELVLTWGPKIEQHPLFPRKTNTEFVQVVNSRELRMRVWERGAGETWACGTGASAVGVAGVLTGRTEREVTVHLKGGDLLIEWRDDGRVYMTGGAEEVFHGTVRV